MSDFLPFKNEAFIDFTIPANRSGLEAALQRIRKEIAGGEIRAYPIIEGKECASSNLAKSVDPSHPEVVVGTVGYATESDASRALASLQKGFPAWRDVGFEHRAQVLIRAAAIMREQKNDIAALIIREVGKTWREADADVAEAIDFCEYYAREALRMATAQKMGDVPGEDNRYFYEARGVAVVIAPWNFPFAIPCGMVVAALVTGNATILKPAEQSSCIAYRLAKILLQAGVPPTAFAFLPAEGETVGRLLVNSPLVDMICFTGSKAVGLEILSAATKVHSGQRNVKKVVAEMGGKNAVIVDEDADFDEALKGVMQSAFGYAGQKCSACSRLIVVGSAYDTFVSRLCEAAGDMLCGDAADPSTFLGPVIDDVTQARILKLVEENSKELTIGFKGTQRGTGYFVPPTIFRDVPVTSKVWKEEIFGPVLACARADSFEAAVAMAVDSQYALTAGVFSRSPAHLQYAREHLRVGNLYLNRGSTGALVYRQPFGGARMSGVGSKAGGPDYLLQFVEPRTVTENTMRRGFAPQ